MRAEDPMHALFIAAALSATPATHRFSPAGKTLDLTVSGGQVTVRTGGSQIVVQSTPRVDDSMCSVEFTETDGPAVVSGPRGQGSSRFARDCSVDLQITLPSGYALDATLASANLDIQHDGPLTATIATGDVKGKLSAASNLQVANGSVALGGLSAPLELKVASGNVALIYDRAPAGSILVQVASGDLHVDLPDDAPVDARVPPGVTLRQPQKTTAETKLSIGKGVGTVTVE